MPDPKKPVPGKDLPRPLPDGSKPIDEPEPDRLPDEIPRPNPDETREPPLQTMSTPPRPVPLEPATANATRSQARAGSRSLTHSDEVIILPEATDMQEPAPACRSGFCF